MPERQAGVTGFELFYQRDDPLPHHRAEWLLVSEHDAGSVGHLVAKTPRGIDRVRSANPST